MTNQRAAGYIHCDTVRMSPRKRYSFWIDDAQAEGLKAVKERDGVLESEQIRRAIDAWLTEKGIEKAGRRPVRSRKRRP